MNFKKSSCSKNYNDRYIPPYQRLQTRNRRWKPKKATKEEELKSLWQQGLLKSFQQPSNYLIHYIHGKTNIFIVDELIDAAKTSRHYSMDTENDANTHKPATLQVEFIRHDLPSTIIIIEMNYLPPTNSPLFEKIQQLCSIIFTSNNTIYSWGPPGKELAELNRFNLFDKEIQIIPINVQDEYDPTNKCGLQSVIESTFKQYLDKTATLAEWGCGIDLILGTYIPDDVVGTERVYRMREEKKYRSILEQYAINDVFAVTNLSYDMRLINLLTPPTTIEQEQEKEEESMPTQQELPIGLTPPGESMNVHEQDELPEFKENLIDYNEYSKYRGQEEISIDLEITPSDNDIGIFDYEDISDSNDDRNDIHGNEILYNDLHLRKVHVIDEPMELQLHDDQLLSKKKQMSPQDEGLEQISDDELDDRSLPEIMKIHLPFRNLYQQDQPKETRVHVTDEPKVRNSYYLGPQLKLPSNPTRNQIKNRRHRANRYRYEVVRRIHGAFRTTDAKEILRAINITCLNINVHKGKLFIGLKNEEQVEEAEKILHERMFTESHYHHYMKKKKKYRSVR